MKFDFIDNAMTDNPPMLGSSDQIQEELLQLKEIAENVGAYKWSYDGNEDIHDGIITQDLLKVPGLKDAVHIAEDGTQSVDTNFLSLATLGYVAALTRLVLHNKEAEDEPKLFE